MKRTVLFCALLLIVSSAMTATVQAPEASASSPHYRSLPYGKIVKYMRHLSRTVCDEIDECIESFAECRRGRNAPKFGSSRDEAWCLLSYELGEGYEYASCKREYIYSLNRSGTLAVKKFPYMCEGEEG
jgi:hypothetical protein